MRRLYTSALALALVFINVPAQAKHQKRTLIVRAVDQRRSEYDYTITLPGSSRTDCSVTDYSSIATLTAIRPASFRRQPTTSTSWWSMRRPTPPTP
jgi:hypothetical protein